MLRTRTPVVLIASLALFGACSSDESSNVTTVGSTAVTTSPPGTTAPTTSVPTTVVLTTVTPATTTPTTVPAEMQLAVWPAAGVVVTTPEAAATDFLAAVFGDGPVIGDFIAGDSRSGEFEVFATVEGAPIGAPRSVLVMRQLGPDDGWFVVAAGSEVATITTPQSMTTVPAAILDVEGVGTGFEATIVVSAFVAGQPDSELDRQVVMAGNLGEALPYLVTLDLSAATPGDVVVVLIRGGTGLETDPGDFGAIPVVIG